MNEHNYFVAIHFEGAAKSYYFSTDIPDLKPGDFVIVDSLGGYEMAIVTSSPQMMNDYHSKLSLKPVIRRPSSSDLSVYQYNIEQAKTALEVARKEASRLGLEMNFLDAKYSLDGSKITITYTADGRVDFRELLKSLAPQLHCRIELRQIAPRDKAKLIGGIGTCGLPLCCNTFLNEFDGIAISRAKNQMLTLNIPKLSGPCGKLICCLLYEDDMYTEAKKHFPTIGTHVIYDGHDYTVTGLNVLSNTVKLENPLTIKNIPLDEFNGLEKVEKNESEKGE